MLVHWIWLAHRPKVSDLVKAALLRHFQDAEDIYCAAETELREIEGLTPEGRDALLEKDLTNPWKIVEACEEKDIRILTMAETGYPERLKHISDPPVVLYYKGRLPDFDGSPVIGVVGTRKASAYGLTTAQRMGYQIAACGGMVVSGMASGIDAMAMQGALLAGAATVGVLGCGVDVVYPASNRKLFQDVEKYGCILSEFAPGEPGLGWHFPKRNRIISGLSNGVLVVEAPERSGALITANLALEQGRDVFAVPGNIDQPGFIGSNRLLRDGAAIVSSGWDILREYEDRYPGKIHRETSPEALPPVETETPRKQKPEKSAQKRQPKERFPKIAIDKAPSGSYSDVNDGLSKLSEDERKIVAALTNGERLMDDVIAEVSLDAGKLISMLTILEIKGIVRRLPGNRITLVRK